MGTWRIYQRQLSHCAEPQEFESKPGVGLNQPSERSRAESYTQSCAEKAQEREGMSDRDDDEEAHPR